MRQHKQQGGFTVVELTVTLVIFSIVALSILGLYTSLVRSTIVAKRQAVGLSLATNQMEYLKSLPYDNLAIAGGSFIGTSPLPPTKTEKINGVTYTLTTSINYVDDAYDGCASYANQAQKELLCRNYKSTTTTVPDIDPRDYKIARVRVTDPAGTRLAEVDTNIAAKVAETEGTTGALFVTVNNGSGAFVPGATVTVTNTTIPGFTALTDDTDTNGIATFYGLPPDSGADYVITVAKSGYSTLRTIGASGSLQPTYPNQRILAQQSSFPTLSIMPQGVPSLLLEATDVNGAPIPNVKVYLKGGYKKYALITNTEYYYDTLAPSDTRPTTNTNGLVGVNNLVPGPYIFCADDGASSCCVGGNTTCSGGTRYYLAAAVPYAGNNSLNPITVPPYDPADPPSTTFAFNSQAYLQKVRLVLTTNANMPRVFTLAPGTVDKSSAGNTLAFKVTGQRLSCGSSGGCTSNVRFVQGTTTFQATCTGTSAQTTLNCSVNITNLNIGTAQLIVGTSSGTLTLPAAPLLGGLRVE